MKKRKNTDKMQRIIDGVCYYIQTTKILKGGVKRRYLHCSTQNCTGTAVQTLNNGEWETDLRKEHAPFCLPSCSLEEKVRFEDAIKNALSENIYGLRQLYDTLAPVYPEASEKISFQDIKQMKIWRKQIFPRNPESLEQFIGQITDQSNSRILQGVYSKLEIAVIVDDNSKTHVIMYDRHLLSTDFKNVNQLYMDGTFKTTPDIDPDSWKQLFTIMGISHGHAFPMIYCLMFSKSEKAYDSVFQLVTSRQLIDALKIEHVMTDFEVGLRKSIIKYFPEARCSGCNVHFDRAICRRINKLKLNSYIKEHKVAEDFLQNIILLAFLPPKTILREYPRIVKELNGSCRAKLGPFIKYFSNFWMKNVKPQGFSIFGLLVRTNNVEEAYHARLLVKFGVHPLPWDFMHKLVKLTDTVHKDLTLLKNGSRIKRHPRYSTTYKQKHILKAWSDFIEKTINAEELLTILKKYKGKINQRLLAVEREFGNEQEDELHLSNTNLNERNVFCPENYLYTEDPEFDANLRDAVMRMDTIERANASFDELNNSPQLQREESQNSDREEEITSNNDRMTDGSEPHSIRVRNDTSNKTNLPLKPSQETEPSKSKKSDISTDEVILPVSPFSASQHLEKDLQGLTGNINTSTGKNENRKDTSNVSPLLSSQETVSSKSKKSDLSTVEINLPISPFSASQHLEKDLQGLTSNINTSTEKNENRKDAKLPAPESDSSSLVSFGTTEPPGDIIVPETEDENPQEQGNTNLIPESEDEVPGTFVKESRVKQGKSQKKKKKKKKCRPNVIKRRKLRKLREAQEAQSTCDANTT